MLDVIIRGARIADGSGTPLYDADIGIADGRIVTLGAVDGEARQIIDGAGLVACPGFIDVHTHYDAQVFWDPQVGPSCYHGVTTAFAGHCGFSIAPLNESSSSYLLHMLARVEGIPARTLQEGVPWNWSSFAEYLQQLEGNVGINIGVMAGHSAIRHVVMGERSLHEEASDRDLRDMKALLGDCLAAGAMGFSTTISPSHSDADGHPVPSRQSSRTELIELAGVLRAHPGTSLEMTPTVGAFEAEHKQLMAEMSVAAQRPLNWNLLAPAIDDSDEFVEGQLNATDLARSLGGEVICLTAGQPILLRVNLHSGFIFDIFEGWGEAFQLPIDERIAFFADPTRRGYLDRAAKNATAKSLMQLAQWENLVVESVVNKALEPNVGLSIGEIAERDGKRPIDAMLDLAVADGLKTVFLAPSVGGNDRESWLRRGRIWSDDRTIIGASDAGAHLDMIDSFALYTHVLGSGVREHGLLPLELAIRQLTQVPAQLYGLHDRGELKPGYRADIVLFDPDTIACGPVYVRHDLPGNEMRLFADAIGIRHVLVNGVETIRDGVHSGALPGSVLRSGRDTHTARMPVAAGVFPQAA